MHPVLRVFEAWQEGRLGGKNEGRQGSPLPITESRTVKKQAKVLVRALVAVVLVFAISGITNPRAALAAETFDRVAARERYRDWSESFLADLRELGKAVAGGEKPDTARINAIFSRSVIPDSRMTTMLVTLAGKPEMVGTGTSRTDPPVRGWASVMFMLLDGALPAGYGGLYHAAKMRPSDAGSFVWYIHVHTDGSMSRVFADPENFKSYHLPPYGVLERDAYPFVSFREQDGKLFITALSAEFVRLVNAIWRMQLY